MSRRGLSLLAVCGVVLAVMPSADAQPLRGDYPDDQCRLRSWGRYACFHFGNNQWIECDWRFESPCRYRNPYHYGPRRFPNEYEPDYRPQPRFRFDFGLPWHHGHDHHGHGHHGHDHHEHGHHGHDHH